MSRSTPKSVAEPAAPPLVVTAMGPLVAPLWMSALAAIVALVVIGLNVKVVVDAFGG